MSTAPITSASRHSRALWNALNAFGIPAGIVRGWGTYPPERIQAFMLSPYFHLFQHDPARAADALHPRDLAERSARAGRRGQGRRPRAARRGSWTSAWTSRATTCPGGRELVDRALAPDLTYQRGGAVLRAAYDPPFFATYYRGLDVVGHTFLRFARPEAVRRRAAGGARAATGTSWSAYAGFLGTRRGRGLAQSLRPGEILLVVSAYGMEPLPPWRRAWETLMGDRWASGTHADAPDGVILAMGDGIRPGATLRSRLRPRHRAHHPLPDGPARGAGHGGPDPDRDPAGRLHARASGDVHPQLREPGRDRPRTAAVPPGLPPLPDELAVIPSGPLWPPSTTSSPSTCRVGTVVAAEVLRGARKPSFTLRWTSGPSAGAAPAPQISDLYEPAELVGLQVIAVVNLPPRRVAGLESEVLVLAVENGKGENVLLIPERPVPDGGKVS